jgi:hypothetical protein
MIYHYGLLIMVNQMNTTQSSRPSLGIDLHCHSNNSDGAHTVSEVLTMAKANGAVYQALTDHDTVEGIPEARQVAHNLDLNLIAGVEISVTWNKHLLHIVGLNVDETNPELVKALANLRALRLERGQRIAANLAKIGIHGALEGALSFCNNPEALSRTHFNKWLVANGYAKPGKAFEKFLAPGKPGYTPQEWASLPDALSWIVQSGGVAVIAHPGRYNFTRTKLLSLIDEFKEQGGLGMEVISSSHAPSDEENIAALCRQTGLLASVGSDFHQAESYRTIRPGINKPLPANVAPIFPALGIKPEFYTH